MRSTSTHRPLPLLGRTQRRKDARELRQVTVPRKVRAPDEQLCQHAAHRPRVHPGAILTGAEQQLWTSVGHKKNN